MRGGGDSGVFGCGTSLFAGAEEPDHIVNLEHAIELTRLIPNARLLILPGGTATTSVKP